MGTFTADLQFSLGIDGLGSSPEHNPLASRSDARPDYQKIQGSASRSFVTGASSELVLNSQFQYSPDRLPSAEQFFSAAPIPYAVILKMIMRPTAASPFLWNI